MTLVRRIPARWTFDADGGFDLDRMNAQIAAWAEYMGLGGWEIRFSTMRPDPDEARGDSNIDVLRRQAAFRLDSNIPASQVDRVIVHELGHVLLAEMEDTFDRAVSTIGTDAQAYLRGDWTRGQEWVIERLASIITGTERESWQLATRPNEHDVWDSAFPVAE